VAVLPGRRLVADHSMPRCVISCAPLRGAGGPARRGRGGGGAGARPPPRLGVIVSSKVLGRAVDRNRAKRMVRETFRAVHGALPPADVVVQVRSAWGRTRASAARGGLAAMLGQIMQERQR